MTETSKLDTEQLPPVRLKVMPPALCVGSKRLRPYGRRMLPFQVPQHVASVMPRRLQSAFMTEHCQLFQRTFRSPR